MAPPIYVKGGLWTNVEDQILKAAVSKYGLTQWARVSSLLPKKTAKQAKARWNEYLNPSIDRTEWTREDDDKLLNLAKLLPNQWRSIAPIMGRTATQCVERYQHLLDEAMNDGSVPEDNDLKLTGPGIETIPALGNAYESLPSRPDAEEMSDDEMEMLSEAKARLANTQGKKAKRKDRERMLVESRRIALLEKRRELKAAGVNISLVLRNKNRRKEFDYNADIPHERQPLAGLYDVSAEDSANETTKEKFQKEVSLKGITDTEKKSKKGKDAEKREGKRQRDAILAAAGAVRNVEEADLAKRRKLDLPEPGAADDGLLEAQILQKSRALLQQDESKPLKVESKGATLAPQVSRKAIIKSLHRLFSSMPTPHHTARAPLPQFEPNAALDDVDDDIGVLGEQQEPVKSLVVARGCIIPTPNLMEQSSEGLSALEELIYAEARELAQLDFDELRGVRRSLEADVDKSKLDEISALVDKELDSKPEPTILPLPEDSDLLTETEIASAKHYIEDLTTKAEAAETALLQHRAVADHQSVQQAQYEKLHKLWEEITDADIEGAMLLQIQKDETLAQAQRSERLHGLVDAVALAEARVALLRQDSS